MFVIAIKFLILIKLRIGQMNTSIQKISKRPLHQQDNFFIFE